MVKSEKLKNLIEEYPVIQCPVCKDFYMFIAIVDLENEVLDCVRQQSSEFCPYCGAMSSVNPSNIYKNYRRYNKKRLKIRNDDGFPVVKFYKLRKVGGMKKCLKS